METKKIEFDLLSFKEQKVTNRIHSYIELREHWLRVVYEFFADEPKDEHDESLGWKNSFIDYDHWILRENIVGVGVERTENPTRYKVHITVKEFEYPVRIYYKLKTDAQELAKTIRGWLEVPRNTVSK